MVNQYFDQVPFFIFEGFNGGCTVVSIVMDKGLEEPEMFPAASVAVAVRE